MTDKTICRNDGRCEYAIQAGIEGLAQCQAGKCSMPKPAHLTIPGALEWDGDNGTHGVVGTHSADGESDFDDAKEACAEVERTGAPGDVIREMNDELVDLRTQLDDYKSKWLANCEALKLLGIHARHAEKLVKSCREKLEVDSVGKGFIEALDGFIGALDRDDNTHGDHGESAAAIATLKALGYTHNGGTHWKPPVGRRPDFDLIDSLREELILAKQSPLYSTRRDAGRYRWLRDHHVGDDPASINLDCASEPGLSAAIDAAMSKEVQP